MISTPLEKPRLAKILGVLLFFMAIPVVLLLLGVRANVALPLIAGSAIAGTLYGCWWTMRIIHSDRRRVRVQDHDPTELQRR